MRASGGIDDATEEQGGDRDGQTYVESDLTNLRGQGLREKPGGEDEDAWRGMEKGAAVQHPLRLLGGEGCGDEWLEAWSRPCR